MAHDHHAFDPAELDALFERVLAGEATPEERDRLEAAFARDGIPPEWSAATARAVQATVPTVEYDATVFAESVHARITVGQNNRSNLSLPARMPVATPSWRRWGARGALGIAAAIGIAFGLSRLSVWPRDVAHVIVSRNYATQRGQRADVTLPDGSTAVLAPETQLRYTRDSHDVESIDVTGEAFFTVTHRARRPFLVRTGAVTTRVLGTAFDVRRYATDRDARVIVVSGRVAVSGRGTPVVLTAGTEGRIPDSLIATVSAIADPSDATAWTEGRLVFRDTPVAAMLDAIGRWYGYRFQLSDSTLSAQHVTVTFHADQMTEALNKLKAVLGVTMTFDDDVITLRPERATDRGRESKVRGLRDSSSHLATEVGK